MKRLDSVSYDGMHVIQIDSVFIEISQYKNGRQFNSSEHLVFLLPFRATCIFINANYKYSLFLIMLELSTILRSILCTLYS